MMGYPSKRLREEVAYLAYYFHWSYEQIMQMDHVERRNWVSELADINTALNAAMKERELNGRI